MNHIYIAPHLDDAVLSCGGAIHHQAAAGETVTIITVFAGDPPTQVPISPFAQVQHGYWGHVPQPMMLRRAEDRAAAARLNASVTHLCFLDAVYRAAADGTWLYSTEASIFDRVHPDDPLGHCAAQGLTTALEDHLPADIACVLYAPLGVGHHVDHQLVHWAARRLFERGQRVAFYEEVPYATHNGAVESALQAADAETWPVETIALEAQDVSAKVAAAAYYHTQLGVLFGREALMPSQLWTMATTRSPDGGLGERLWWPPRA